MGKERKRENEAETILEVISRNCLQLMIYTNTQRSELQEVSSKIKKTTDAREGETAENENEENLVKAAREKGPGPCRTRNKADR